MAYLQRAFPEISVDMWAKIDGSLVPLTPFRLVVVSENAMDRKQDFVETATRVVLSPDVSFPTNGSVASSSNGEQVSIEKA